MRASAGRTAHVLIGLLDREAEGHLVAGVIEDAHARLTRPGKTRHVIDVYDLGVEQIARQCRDDLCGWASACSSSGRRGTPTCPCVRQPRTGGGGAQPRRWKRRGARAAGAVEVELVIADEVRALPVAIHPETETRVLNAEMGFREVAVGRVVITARCRSWNPCWIPRSCRARTA